MMQATMGEKQDLSVTAITMELEKLPEAVRERVCYMIQGAVLLTNRQEPEDARPGA